MYICIMEKIRKLIDLPVEEVKKIRHLIADETSMSVKSWMESTISGAIKSKWSEKEKRPKHAGSHIS